MTSLNEFKSYFAKFGELTDAMLSMKSKDSKLNKGFGFVTFKYSKQAKAVLNYDKPHLLRAKCVN